MNSKGQFDLARKSIYWMIASVVITMVVIFFVMIIASYQSNLTALPPELLSGLVSLRFTQNTHCFAYQDTVTGKVYPGVIDLAKFNTERMRQCYSVPEEGGYRELNFRLVLVNSKIELVTNDYYHVDKLTTSQKVLVWNGVNFIEDTLQINTQVDI